MGDLADAVRQTPRNRGGQRRGIDLLAEVLPPDVMDDIYDVLSDPSVAVPNIRLMVMRKYPDAPVFGVAAWYGWAKERRG